MEIYDVDQVRRTQEVALKLLNVFNDICKKQDFTYYAIGGTCIGAIRHKGFIPWDDDVDVAMPIEDYYNFINYCKKNLEAPFEILDPRKTKHYFSFYHKIQDSSTTFIEKFAENYPDRYAGIYIDIFPICGLPKNKEMRNIVVHKTELLKKINAKLRFSFFEMSNVKAKITWLLTLPLQITVPFYWASDKILDLIHNYKLNTSDKIYFPWRDIPGSPGSGNYKNIFYYEDFSKAVEYPFENTTIMVPAGFDRYLKMDFGDYMKLPPEEDRVPGHPKAIVDFTKSYKFYVENKGKN